jgi:hypothetical protein
MVNVVEQKNPVSPMRLLEMLSDRFGAFEAIAYSTIKLAPFVSPDELSMDLLVAEAVLEFGDDLRQATAAADRWAHNTGHRAETCGLRTAAPRVKRRLPGTEI